MRGGRAWVPRGRFPEWLGAGGGAPGTEASRAFHYQIPEVRASFLPGTAPPAPTLVDFLTLAHSLCLRNFPHWVGMWEALPMARSSRLSLGGALPLLLQGQLAPPLSYKEGPRVPPP